MSDLRFLAEELGVSDRTLRRAVVEGTIRAARLSPRRLVLTPGERAYLRRNWALLSALRTALRTEPNVRLAVLIGSFARGTASEGSDVDLIVELDDAEIGRVADLAARLTETVGHPVQLVRAPDALANPPLLVEIVRDGRAVVDRGQRWPTFRRRARKTIRAQAAPQAAEVRAVADELGL